MSTDWVLLTAMLVGLALATYDVVRSGTGDLTGEMASTVSNLGINTSF